MDYHRILSEAFQAPAAYSDRPNGCCRIYVCIAEKAHRRGIKAAAKKLGRTYQTEAAYGFRHVLYVGYDNNTGAEWGKGKALAAALSAAGVPAFVEMAGD